MWEPNGTCVKFLVIQEVSSTLMGLNWKSLQSWLWKTQPSLSSFLRSQHQVVVQSRPRVHIWLQRMVMNGTNRMKFEQTSFHEHVEERCIGEEEQVGKELWGDLGMNSDLMQEVIGRLKDVDDLLHATVAWWAASIGWVHQGRGLNPELQAGLRKGSEIVNNRTRIWKHYQVITISQYI